MKKRAKSERPPAASPVSDWDLGYLIGLASERYTGCPQCGGETDGTHAERGARAWKCRTCHATLGVAPFGREAEFNVPLLLELGSSFEPGEVRFFDWTLYPSSRPSEHTRHRGWFSTKTGRIVNLVGRRLMWH